MRRKIEQLIVIDIEATCWANNAGKRQEIIEIGCVPIILSELRINSDNMASFYIKPEETEISEFCTNLTGITNDLLNKFGRSFTESMDKIKTKYSPYAPYAAWGDFDRNILTRECAAHGLDIPFGGRYYNLKELYAIMNGDTREKGLVKALHDEGMDFIGDQHSGKYDALNAARIIAKKIAQARGYRNAIY